MEINKIKFKQECEDSKNLEHCINNMFTIIDGEAFKQFKAFTPKDSKVVVLSNNLYNILADISKVPYVIKLDDTLPEEVVVCTTQTTPELEEIYYDFTGIITFKTLPIIA